MTNASRIKPSRGDRWVNRVLIATLLCVGLFVAWPTLRGVYYGLFPRPPIPADLLPAWRHDFKAALAESATTGKPVLAVFTAEWCPPCKVMEADVWPDDAVRDAIAERVIPLKLDLDKPDTAGPEYRYDVQFIPTILLLDAGGNVLARRELSTAGEMLHFITDHAPAPLPTPTTAPLGNGPDRV